MLSRTSARVGASVRTAGRASLIQGVYGARGNLELLACDETDGLWVFWFNSDLATDPLETPDVPPGSWSSGLRFAAGTRYTDAVILQSTLGPDHLEVLALTADHVLQSWYWSPGPGFQRRADDVASDVLGFAAAHRDGVVTVTVRLGRRELHLVSDAADYPDRTWAPAPTGPALIDDEDARHLIESWAGSAADIAAGTARRIVSTRGGGTAELVWRDADGTLHHVGVPLS